VTSLHLLSQPLDDGRRGDLIFRGDILVFKGVEPLHELRTRAEALIAEELGDGWVGDRADTPEAALLARVRDRFARDPRAKELVCAVLETVGADLGETFWDWLYLRMQAPDGSGDSSGQTLAPHRDTWSSNVYQQTNWWTPIRPVSEERTIAFFPAYWLVPIGNSSADWDLDEVRARRKAGDTAVEMVPELTEPVAPSSELRIVIEPGDLLCFSGAHLHASVPNTSDRARVSLEVRTVNAADMKRRGALNIDGQAPRVPLNWFRGVRDGAPLSSAIP
jgi:hypothetical protein